MSKLLVISLILLRLFNLTHTLKRCNFSECNHEGECYEDDKTKENRCSCIGDTYFKGPKCFEAIDSCQASNPCQNDGSCRNLVGQFICENCSTGFGGLWCDLEISNAFEKMLLYFNHYAYYGQTHTFLVMVESLGERGFSLELVSENYAFASFETMPEQANLWIYSQDLVKVIKQLGIRYYRDLPYAKGYYHVATKKFWNVGLLELTLRSYDSETATKLLYQNHFPLLLLSHNDECVPNLSFLYGRNPLEPLIVDIASYNYFEVVLNKRCFSNSHISYYWSIYNSIGTIKLHDFGFTTELLLKIQPYKLWFNYHNEVASSYCVVAKMVEQYKNYKKETQARCFILVLPKPVSAIIKGGHYREIGMKQTLILDATNSRDFALEENHLQDFFYKWDCFSMDHGQGSYCRENISTASTTIIKAGNLQVHHTYNITLTVRSKINKFVFDQTQQVIKVVENLQINIDIKCLRNCLRNEFVQGYLMHMKAVPLEQEFSQAALFKWFLDDQVIGERINLIYLIPDNRDSLNISIMIQDGNLSGKSFNLLKANLPPQNGSCFIQPNTGEAFVSNFHIKCNNYTDQDLPLSYEYLLEDGFVLQRTSKAEIYIKLPPCRRIVIKICDQFKACTETNLEVKVRELQQVKDIKNFIKQQPEGLRHLLGKGEILKAMVLLKSLSNEINTTDILAEVFDEMNKFKISTLLQLEQFLTITKYLVVNNLPLTFKKAYVFNKYFMKLKKGFECLVRDNEIQSFQRQTYEKSLLDLLAVMQLFARAWEIIPPVQTIKSTTILSSNPLKESQIELNDFDVQILQQLENWLNAIKFLNKGFDFMSQAAKKLYAPWEYIFSVQEIHLNLQIYAIDNNTQQIIYLNNNSINIILSGDLVKELQQLYNSPEILIRTVGFNSNPFWWYPSETPLNSQIFLISAVSRKITLRSVKYFKNSFKFELSLKPHNAFNIIPGVIKNNLHRAVYAIELPANAVLIITFLKADKTLKFLLKLDTSATSFEVLKQGCIINTSNYTLGSINNANKNTRAYLSILMAHEFKNVTFSFQAEVLQCLYWDFSLEDPQWSGQGCKPQIENIQANNGRINCSCHHFSYFTAKSYSPAIQEDIRERWLLKELPLSWYMIKFHFGLFLLLVSTVLLNIYKYNNHKQYLPTSFNDFMHKDIEVHIYTGSQMNSTTTANVSLMFVSPQQSFALKIYQNPKHPFLKCNSMCKLLISSQIISMPLKLVLTQDQSGRYHSWFCHKIVIINLKTRQKLKFLVDQWIYDKPLEIQQLNKTHTKFKQRFLRHLAKFYINWYQFEALWGCWLFGDLNRLERCCIELSVLMATVCLTTCYFGSTTLETYEDERDLYNYLSFNILELFFLSLCCCLLNFIIKLIFCGLVNIFYKFNFKQKKNSKKIV